MFQRFRQFYAPDYASLIICDKVVMDEASFEILTSRRRDNHPYSLVAQTFSALKDEGLVDLVDFDAILSRKSMLLRRMLSNDLDSLDRWIAPLRDSLEIWHRFLHASSRVASPTLERHRIELYMHDMHSTLYELYFLADSPHEKTNNSNSELRRILKSYLSYVNSNIVLANELDIGFHDWKDYGPFYERKFLGVGVDTDGFEPQIQAARALFELSFPEFRIYDTPTLIRVLKEGLSDFRCNCLGSFG